MYRVIRTGLICAFIATSTQAIAAQGKGKGQGKGNGNAHNAAPSEGSLFGKETERIIREWFASPTNMKGLPPGLAKKEQLPPGLQKQLARNGELPPGLQKKVQPLPPQLEIRLPRLPDGRRRIVIAGNVILLEERTARILDIIRAVF
jgi:hypothetical protein